MITREAANRFAHQVGTDLHSAQQEVVLLFALDRLARSPLAHLLAFKGGTYLRKMILGDAGRLSEDLDFTAIGAPEEPLPALEAAFAPAAYGLAFELHHPYRTDRRNWACSIRYRHSWDEGEFRVEVSYREKPFLAPIDMAPQRQIYFGELPFIPPKVCSLRMEEALAEKLRAVQQRATERDLYDVGQYARKGFNSDLVRLLAVAKLWSDHDLFDPEKVLRILAAGRSEWPDLERLVARRRQQDWNRLSREAAVRFAFLTQLTVFERSLIEDRRRHRLRDALQEALARHSRVLAT